mgnify:CR=1 FL=1
MKKILALALAILMIVSLVTLTSCSKSFPDTFGSDAVALVKEAHHDAGNDGDGSGILDAAGAGAYQIDQQNQRQQQIELLK